MRIKVQFYATFREILGTRERRMTLETNADVRTLLEAVFDSPRLRREIFEGSGLKPLIIVLVNGRHIQHLDGLDTRLEEGDVVSVFPAVAGG